ncbi:MAG: hypothetical protein WCC60_22775 [Ilumatobacteraceae bacterium]
MLHLLRRLAPTVALTLVVVLASSCLVKKDAGGNTLSCRADHKTLEVASETYFAEKGELPASIDDLVKDGLLREAPTQFLMVPSVGRVEFVAVEGGKCAGVDFSVAAAADMGPVSDEDACAIERKTLEVASEAYAAQFGVAPASEAELVTAGFLRSEMVEYDLQGGAVVAVSGVCV